MSEISHTFYKYQPAGRQVWAALPLKYAAEQRIIKRKVAMMFYRTTLFV
jgi:hypothetical protein